MPRPRVFVIGLDGATLELVSPWAKKGLLPNLSRFLERGTYGFLRSTIPVHSSAAWSTFATGTNPGKHGIADFVQFVPESYAPSFIDATKRHGETFWEIAGRQGIRGGIINVPVTYPPRPYDGFLVSGLLSPGVTRQIASPPAVFDDLIAASPEYVIDVEMIKTGVQDVRLEFFKRILTTVQARLAAALGLYRKYRPPLCCVVFRGADQASHYFWSHMEALQAGSPKTDTERELGEAIKSVYQELDQAVGALIKEVEQETDVVLLSDHGSGPLRKGLNVQAVLAKSGLLVRTRASLLSSITRKAIWSFARLAPLSLKNRIKARFAGLSSRAAGRAISHSVDFSKTRAYPVCDSEGIFVNLEGRQPQGIVPPEQYEAVRDEIIKAFSELTDPETGEKVASKVFRREEIWSGPNLCKLPDVTFEQAAKVYYIPPPIHTTDELFYPLPESSPTSLSWNGDHRRDGLIMGLGPHIRHTEIHGANIVDVPATILALLGCKIPDNFDGRVLTEMLTEDVEVPERIPSGPVRPQEEGVYTEEEQDALKRRLKGLGYM